MSANPTPTDRAAERLDGDDLVSREAVLTILSEMRLASGPISTQAYDRVQALSAISPTAVPGGEGGAHRRPTVCRDPISGELLIGGRTVAEHKAATPPLPQAGRAPSREEIAQLIVQGVVNNQSANQVADRVLALLTPRPA